MSLVPTLRTVPGVILSALVDARRDHAWLHVRSNNRCSNGGSNAASLPNELVSVREMTTAAQEVLQATASTPTAAAAASVAIIYDVLRVRDAQPLFYHLHMRRFCNSICSHFQLPPPHLTGDVSSWPKWFLTFDDAMKATITRNHFEPNDEQNIKIIAWENGLQTTPAATMDAAASLDDKASALSVAAFFIPSSYPPREWYLPPNGAVASTTTPSVALLYNAGRTNPNAKIVQAPLRLRAQEQQRKLGAFESVIVHGREDQYKTPEGSRSNILIVLDNGCIVSSLEPDILVGVTLVALKEALATTSNDSGGAPLVLEHRVVALRDLVTARSLVMLGTSVGILPLASVVVFATPADEAEFCAAMGIADSTTVDGAHSMQHRAALYSQLGVQVETLNDGSRVGRLTKQSAADPVVAAMRAAYNKLAYQRADER